MKGEDQKTERFEMRAPTRLLSSVDDWRRHQPDLPSRSEAIRRLIETGLKGAQLASPAAGGPPGGSTKGKTAAPRPKKPTVPPRKTSPARSLSRLDQIRALREQGAG
jgi:hypothetical protein